MFAFSMLTLVVADNLLLGCVVGIGVGIVLSIARTLYVDRKRRRR